MKNLSPECQSELDNQIDKNRLTNRTKLVAGLRLLIAGAALAMAGCSAKLDNSNIDTNTSHNLPDVGVVDGGVEKDAEVDTDASKINCDSFEVRTKYSTATTVLAGAQNVQLICLAIADQCNSPQLGELSADVVLSRSGVGSIEDLKNVRNDVLGKNFQFDQSNQVEMTDLKLQLRPDPVSINCFMADVSDAAAGGAHEISLKSVKVSGKKMILTSPLEGNSIQIGSALLPEVDVAKSANSLVNLPAKSGHGKIAEFDVTMPSSSAGYLGYQVLKIGGSCGLENLQNVSLHHDGVQVGQSARREGDKLVVYLNQPMKLKPGSKSTFSVEADYDCQAGKTTKTCLENGHDLSIADTTFNLNLPVNNQYNCTDNYSEVKF